MHLQAGQSARKVVETFEMEQRRKMQHDAKSLLVVATDLSVSLGSVGFEEDTAVSTRDEAWRRAEIVERLAHSVKSRMLGAH